MLVLGLVGHMRAGKEELTKYLETSFPQRTIVRVSSSGFLGQILELLHLPASRENLQTLPIILEQAFGERTVAAALFHQLEAAIHLYQPEVLILDAIRWLDQYQMVRRWPRNLVVGIEAPLTIRYQRLPLTSEKVGEAGASFEEFCQSQTVATETAIDEIIKKADIRLTNDTMSLAAYHQTIRRDLFPRLPVR